MPDEISKKLAAIDAGLVEALTKRGYSDKEIVAMTANTMFDEYCGWHGLIGWGPQLRRIYEATRKHGASNAR